MKKIIFYIIVITFYGCKKQTTSINCSQVVAITANTIASLPCEANGKIIITSPLGNNYSYQINNLPFQKSTEFVLLKPNSYIITVKDENNCTSNAAVKIDTISGGIKFKNVATTLATYCTPCHTGNNPQAGLLWLNPCDILQYWDRIKTRAVDGSPSPMPPSGLIPIAERNKILDWINAGHSYNN
jgi:hypothetical protein